MSLRRKLSSADAVAHCNAESKTHENHVEQRKARGEIEWVAVPASKTAADATVTFGLDWAEFGLPRGECFTNASGALREMPGQEFEVFLSRLRKDRGWFWQPRKLKDGRESKAKRKRKNSIVELVVSLTPAQSLYLRHLSGTEIKEVMRGLLRAIAPEATAATGWELLGSTIHYDSSRPHLNFYMTRVSADHQLVGNHRLRTAGAWSVAQWRLARAGIGGEIGNRRLSENLQKFATRHGREAEPLDMRLHRLLDEVFEQGLTEAARERLKVCEEKHKEWKLADRVKIVAKRGQGESLAMALLQVVKPFLPPPIRSLLIGVQQISGVIRALRQLLPEDSLPLISKDPFQPSLNL